MPAASKNRQNWRHYRRSRDAGLTFRRIQQRDLAFLSELYASTRADEVATTGWSEEEAKAFLQQQFEAQHKHYMENYPDADWLVVIRERRRIGRLYLERWPSQHRLIDIALLPAFRGLGLGAAKISDLMDEAKEAEKALSLHVEKFNPALELYRRFGFETVEDKGVYDLMRWPGESRDDA